MKKFISLVCTLLLAGIFLAGCSEETATPTDLSGLTYEFMCVNFSVEEVLTTNEQEYVAESVQALYHRLCQEYDEEASTNLSTKDMLEHISRMVTNNFKKWMKEIRFGGNHKVIMVEGKYETIGFYEITDGKVHIQQREDAYDEFYHDGNVQNQYLYLSTYAEYGFPWDRYEDYIQARMVFKMKK